MSEQTLTIKVRVANELGLHTRPATLIVKLLQEYKSEVLFTYKKETINARSILNILMLAAPKNAVISITAKGIDARETLNQLVSSFENRFGEELPYA